MNFMPVSKTIKTKDSGLEWVGSIPANWNVTRLKWSVLGCQNGIWGSDPDGISDLTVVRVADFDRFERRVSLSHPTKRAVRASDREGRLLKKGDLLMEKSGGGEKQPVGMIVIFDHDEEAVCSNFVAKMTAAEGYYPEYLNFLHQAFYDTSLHIKSVKQSTGIQNLDSNSYLDECAPFPPFDEQVLIAKWLIKTNSQIDTLIAKKTRFIELLKEKRQAVITKAVTKGLDDSVEMKDSGVEWIGTVPKTWRVTKLGYLTTKIGSGKTPSGGATVYLDHGVLFLRSQNVYDDGLRLDDVVHISEETHDEMANSAVAPNDVLLNITGASIGRSSLVPGEFPRANVNQHVCIVRCPNKDLAEFVHLFLCSNAAKGQIDSFQTGAGREGLNFEQLANFKLALPPLMKIAQITAAIKEAVSRLDALMEKTERSIDLLKEKRSALITAAVTGKIDVREAA